MQDKITATNKKLQQKLESYLRYTSIERISPESIENKLNELWQEANDRLPDVSEVAEIDRNKLIAVLERRKGLERSNIDTIVEGVETSWEKITNSSKKAITQIQTDSLDLSKNLLEYLQKVIENNLTASQIEKDLQQLFKVAGTEIISFSDRLFNFNWDDLSKTLQQNQKYTETQIKRAIEEVKRAIRKLLKVPRRWAIRTSKQIKDTMGEIEDFLSYGNKNDLTPEKIQRNLQSMLNLSKIGSDRSDLVERLAQQTPDKIASILARRKDLSSIKIEHIRDRVANIIEELSTQVKENQTQINELFQTIFDRLDRYFNSLHLFSLDYDKIKETLTNFDFKTWKDSFKESLKDLPVDKISERFGQLSYEALVTIIKGDRMFAEAIPDPVLKQIQGVQNYIAGQVETTKEIALEKVEIVKQQALKQAEETRDAIAVAIYWLFAIFFSSFISSALAGILATTIDLKG